MKIDDVLKSAPSAPQVPDYTEMYFHGVVQADPDTAYFRLYRKPESRRSYLLVKKADVSDLYEWTPEEAAQRGFVGAKVHQFSLKIGTELLGVSVTVRKVGDPFPVKPRNQDVCCCDNCTDQIGCGRTSAAECQQIGEICSDSQCS